MLDIPVVLKRVDNLNTRIKISKENKEEMRNRIMNYFSEEKR